MVRAGIDLAINNPQQVRARADNLHKALIDFLDPHEVLLPFSHKKD